MKRILLLLVAVFAISSLSAQIRIGKRGQLAASLESNSIYYVDDSKIGEEPIEKFGSHNFLKLDYTLGRFSVGVQGNAFLPVQLGFNDLGYGDCKFFLSKYIQWADKNYEILVGDVYDQFGNGLVFRSFEDRQLGINNSIEGGRVIGRLGQWGQIKALGGRQRLNTSYSDTWVMGADLSLSLAEMFRMDEMLLSLEGSFVNRMEDFNGEDELLDELLEEMGQEKNVQLYSGRLNFGYKGFSLRGEYAARGKDMANSSAVAAEKGTAFLGEIGYSHGNFSAMGMFRRLEHMGTHISIYNMGINNTMNYLPALTRQYTYMLANLNPYQVNVEGELGGQVDLAYSLRSTESRYRYWNFHVNYSTYYMLNADQNTGKRNLLWQDLNFDVERQWSKKVKTTFLFSRQEWNPNHGWDEETYASNIFVGDFTYKFNRKHSLRVEAQYLLSNDYEGDWVAGLVEYSFAPMWSFYFSDMYNLGETDTNYYNGGVSWSKNRTRLQLSYGRNRAGYICSGGVCRYSPAYTGVNFMLTTSF